MKIELGSGERPTSGYLHQDIIQLSTTLDFLCPAWELPVEINSISEVIAIAVMEHLRIEDFRKTLTHVYNILRHGGVFYFDVPDIKVWSYYLYTIVNSPEFENSNSVPYTKTDIYKTIVGWNRWPGDEHKSLWTREDIEYELKQSGFYIFDGLEDIKSRVHRDRFYRPENAHIYIKAVK
jgi:predicted SAM-dependent methyltransferase